ncbi:MAG TPA: AraC family transcriptional regulator ligand-binding domain-containing protein, partial [Polyangiales bacterium]|nr:AraC family transcriptional regulator ligand-binding domain-containing protein [Polyangiales bacterium]
MGRAQTHDRSLPALQLQPIALALPQLGIDPSQLFARLGVSIGSLNDPQVHVPASVELELWSALVATTGDPLIGLKLADVIPDGAYWTYEYLLR